jgi:hypothetical protein
MSAAGKLAAPFFRAAGLGYHCGEADRVLLLNPGEIVI